MPNVFDQPESPPISTALPVILRTSAESSAPTPPNGWERWRLFGSGQPVTVTNPRRTTRLPPPYRPFAAPQPADFLDVWEERRTRMPRSPMMRQAQPGREDAAMTTITPRMPLLRRRTRSEREEGGEETGRNAVRRGRIADRERGANSMAVSGPRSHDRPNHQPRNHSRARRRLGL
ncbi:hypothetical protein BC936DRAFT_149655, partial [Jimgerdemannia flammicorona]